MQQDISKQSNESEIQLNINFIQILRILLDSKRLIILVTIAFGAIGWMYSSYFNPAQPPNVESASVVEMGSYPAPDNMQLDNLARQGRLLVYSMEATITRLDALFGMHRSKEGGGFTYITDYDADIHRIRIYEIDSQFLKVEVVGKTFEIVQNKTNEIIEYIKTLHADRLNEVISLKKRERESLEKKLLTLDKFINYIFEKNDIYISDIAQLKLKEIEYNYDLAQLNMHLNHAETFRNTNIVGETMYKTNYPPSNLIKLTVASFILGLALSSLFVFIRHALNQNDEE